MQEIIRRCDREVKGQPCGERVPDDAPTTFVVNSVAYEMDICAQHYQEFFDALEPYLHIAAPTKARAGKAVRQVLRSKKGPFTTKDVRKWLQEQGKDVSPTGRIPNALIEEYKAAQGV